MNRNCLFNKALALLLCAVLLVGFLPSVALPAAAASDEFEGEMDIVETTTEEPTTEEPTTPPEGSEGNPILLPELVNNVNVPAGQTVYYYGYFSGMLMTVTGNGNYIYNGETVEIDGVAISVNSDSPRNPIVVAIQNTGDADADYTISFAYPQGHQQNPEEIGPGLEYTAKLEADNDQGYNFKYTAEKTGTLMVYVSVPETVTGYGFTVSNLTTGVSGDQQWSDNSPVNPYSLDVTAGDEIVINVCTWDPSSWGYPEGEVTVKIEYKPGTEANPILLPELVNNVNVPAGQTVYYHGNFSGMLMTVTGAGNYIYNGETAEIDGAAVAVDSGSFWSKDIVVAIQNTGDADADYTISFVYPLGSMDNPATAVLGDNNATVAEGTEGYFFTYTAAQTGTLVMTMPAGDWQYTVNNLTTGVNGELQDSSMDLVVNPYELEVTAGDEIEIIVNTFNPEDVWTAPAGSVSFNLAYKPIVDENLKFIQTGLSFQEYIGMQSLITKAVVDSYDSFRVEAVQVTPNGEVVETIAGTEFYGYYYVYDKQILSWSMTDEVTITIYAEKDGVKYQSVPVTTSVKALAMDKIASYYASNNLTTAKALVDMLNYGAEVQTTYNYNATSLPNVDLGSYSELGTSETPTFNATNSKSGTGTISVLQDGVSMQSKVEIQMLFAGDVSAYEVRYTVDGVTNVIPASEFGDFYGYKLARVAIKAANMRKEYTIALYDPATGEPVTQVYTLSIEAYAQTMLGGTYNNVFIAMMKYGDSVAAMG